MRFEQAIGVVDEDLFDGGACCAVFDLHGDTVIFESERGDPTVSWDQKALGLCELW